MMAGQKCMMDLPNEILLKIFSYVTTEDLVYSVQHVCERWRDVSQDSSLWNDRTYHPYCTTSDSEIKHFLQQAPKLLSIILTEKIVQPVIFNIITQYCPYIKRLELNSLQNVNITQLKILAEKCPYIQYLRIPYDVLSNPKKLRILGKFYNLTELSDGDDREAVLKLRLIADICPKLKIINVINKSHNNTDLKYFLKRRKAQLLKLTLRWMDIEGASSLPLIGVCSVLEELHLFCFFGNYEEDLYVLQSLKSLRALFLYGLNNVDKTRLIDIFLNQGMTQLEHISLVYYKGYHDILGEVIIANCPNLTSFHLCTCFGVTDQTVQNLRNLTMLESINLNDSRITDAGMAYIMKCKNLKYLSLKNCKLLTKRSMKLMIELSELRVLKLNWCNVEGLPLHLIKTHLTKLQLLGIKGCQNIDREALAQLKAEMEDLIFRSIYKKKNQILAV